MFLFQEKKAVVVGSGMTGCETAEMLAAQGNTVTLVEMQDQIGNGIYAPILVDISQKLMKHQVKTITNHKVTSIGGNCITVVHTKTGQPQVIDADQVVLSLGVKPRQNLLTELEAGFPKVRIIGDGGKVGRIAEAVREGYEKAYVL